MGRGKREVKKMGRKKNTITGKIFSVIAFIVWFGLFIALLKRFDWDIMLLLEWFLSLFLELIDRISNWFLTSPTFQRVVP